MLIADSFVRVPLLAKLVERFPGLRVPGSWDPFETAVCTILGQVVSAEQRASLVGQLVRDLGVDPDQEGLGVRALDELLAGAEADPHAVGLAA